MKTLLSTITVLACISAQEPVLARETGTINQAGTYEKTLKFYLHPAHFFWNSGSPVRVVDHPAVVIKRAEATQSHLDVNQIKVHPALLGQNQSRSLLAQTQAKQ